MNRPFQKILSATVQATLKSGLTMKVCINDLKIGSCSEIADFMVRNFYSAESFSIASGVNKSKRALEEMQHFLFNNLPKFNVIACYAIGKNDTPLVAVSLMQLITRDTSKLYNPEIFSAIENKKQFNMTEDLESRFNVLEEFGVDSYYNDFGAAVAPEYQKLGIATHFGLVRKWVCEQNDIPLCCSLMTSPATQFAAERAGHVTCYQIPSADFAKRHNVNFQNAPPMFKVMVQGKKFGNLM